MNAFVIGIIQARFGATRLPGKVLLPLAGKTVLEHVIMRVRASEKIDEVMVATADTAEDKKIVELCKRLKVQVFSGSEDDVLDRFYRGAQLAHPEHVVRITADCPAVDPAVIREVVKEHLAKGADYTSNTIVPTYPDGEDVEVFRMSVLKETWTNARLSSEREHVTSYMKKNPDKFKLINVAHPQDLSKKRWTLDEERDYEFLKIIFENLYTKNHIFGMEEILGFLKYNSNIEKINSDIMQNEGYQKSLQKDQNGQIPGTL